MKINNIEQNSQVLSSDATARILFLQSTNSGKKEPIIKDMISQIKKEFTLELGFYPDENRFIIDLTRRVFGDSENAFLPDVTQYKDKIQEIVIDALKACHQKIPFSGDLNVFVLPMNDAEASEDLEGVNAFAVGKNTIYILLDPENKKWELSLKYTIAHEYAHLISAHYFPWNSILAGIVFEGLAECFRESVFGGEPAKYSIALSQEEAIENLRTISRKEILSPNDEEHYNLYLSYFFGTEKLPNWYGYSLGYWLILLLLERNEMSLETMFKTNPTVIFDTYYK